MRLDTFPQLGLLLFIKKKKKKRKEEEEKKKRKETHVRIATTRPFKKKSSNNMAPLHMASCFFTINK